MDMRHVRKVSIIILGLMLVLQPRLSYADWAVGFGFGGGHHDRHERHHHYRYHDHPRFGVHVNYLPTGYFTIHSRGGRYYYYDGVYYNMVGREYVIIAPPVGAVVNMIPPDYRAVNINGVTYYTDNGTYYVYTLKGFQVVPPPVIVQPTQVLVTQSAPTVVSVPTTEVTTQVNVTTDDSYSINVPNSKGGYSPVLIKRSGNGFIGPQGEFYAEFPKVSQLQAMYGK